MGRLATRLLRVVALVCSFSFAGGAGAAIWRVDDSTPASLPNQDGTSWGTAFATIQQATANNELQAGDYIWVAQGTYKPYSNSEPIELVPNVRIHGGYAGYGATNPDQRVPSTYLTIISGDLDGDDTPGDFYNDRDDNIYRVIYVPGNCAAPSGSLENGANLDGFTIKGGHAIGAGGGAIYVDQGTTSSPVIRGCIFTDNAAMGGSVGGAAMCDQSAPVFRNCLFIANFSEDAGGGAGSAGVNSHPKFINCEFQDNVAKVRGGGFGANRMHHATFVNCVFEENSATGTGSFCGEGGGIGVATGTGSRYDGSIVSLVNCKLVQNTATSTLGCDDAEGGGIFAAGPALTLTNCTLSDNEAGGDDSIGGGIYFASGAYTLTLKNSIVWGNDADDVKEIAITNLNTGNTASYSNIRGINSTTHVNTALTYNTGTTPDTIGSNLTLHNPNFDSVYRLQCESPSINTGSDTLAAVDGFDVNENGNSTTEKTPDLDLAKRLVVTVDMGAYEKQPSNSCLADITQDGVVNVPDLLAVISSWGPCVNPPCPADIAPVPCLNGEINVGDMLLVIQSWGMVCATGGGSSSMPTSISDCFNIYCSGLSGAEWQDCINKCIETVCQNNPSECE